MVHCGVTIGVLVNQKSEPDNAALPTIGYSTPSSNPYDAGSPCKRLLDAHGELRRPKIPGSGYSKIADGGRAFVSAQLADHWVPLLSTKHPGTSTTESHGITP